uniref:Uncharacterized protein n=1 Tax=Peronospora matthiolae TaxID=2874970 RepID=A0AAV1V732_9STRA
MAVADGHSGETVLEHMEGFGYGGGTRLHKA